MQPHNYQRFVPSYGQMAPPNSFNYFKPFYSIYNEQYPYFNLNMNFFVNPYSFAPSLQYQQPLYNIMPNSFLPNPNQNQSFPLYQPHQDYPRTEHT